MGNSNACCVVQQPAPNKTDRVLQSDAFNSAFILAILCQISLVTIIRMVRGGGGFDQSTILPAGSQNPHCDLSSTLLYLKHDTHELILQIWEGLSHKVKQI